MRTRSTFVVVAMVGIACARNAEAEGPATSDHDAAVAEFSAGRALFEAGNCTGAMPRFVASLKREQSVGARFNLAECSARLGRTAEAWNHYKAAEQLAIRKGDAQRVKLAHAAAADLDQLVTKVRLVLPADVPVTLTIDGAAVDVTDHWLLATGYALEPGSEHTLTAASAGKPAWKRGGVRGAPGVELAAMVVDLGRDAEPRPAQERASPLRPASLVIGGLGVAALATGGVFALLASSAKSDAERACASGPAFAYPAPCDPAASARGRIDSANDRAQTNATVATVAVVGGAVLVSAGVALFLISRGKSTSATAPTLRGFGSAGPGALLGGSF